MHTLDEESASANMNLQSERFSSSFSYQTLHSRKNNDTPASHTARLSLSSALVFSGGHFALTRPVSDGFLIVAKAKSISKNTLYVNPLGNDYLAKSMGILPAVVPDIRDYEYKEVLVDDGKEKKTYKTNNIVISRI